MWTILIIYVGYFGRLYTYQILVEFYKIRKNGCWI